MDYRKLVNDLLSDCPKNCADCEYSEGVEFNCTMSRMAADAILELFIENKILNKKNSDLQARAESAEARCNMLEKMVKKTRKLLFLGM